jgi:two-component system, chemotaxis family, chemotaxis protein CheY
LGAKKRVLVIEDDEAIRRLLQDLLVEAGYEVDLAKSGNEGLARVGQLRPDVILLDKLMPDGDGPTFANAYAKTPGPRAPIIAVGAGDSFEWAAEIGAAAVVQKPFDIDELLDVVRAQLPAGRGA